MILKDCEKSNPGCSDDDKFERAAKRFINTAIISRIRTKILIN
jgi:hypothetical protein